MSRRSFGLVLAITLATAGAADAPATGLGPSPIVNGDPTTDYPAVVAILLDGKRHCTGTVVTRRVVVTAGHCLVSKGVLSIYIGSGLDAEAGVHLAVSDKRLHPGFDPASLTNDIGVLLLEHEAPVAPIPIFGGFWDPSFVGRQVELVGFGAISGDEQGPHLKRMGTARLVSYDATTLRFTGDPARTCSGDSGGPAFLRLDGDLMLIGVTSSGDRACTKDPTDTRADAYMATFIGPYVAAQSRMARTVGEECRANDQCIEHRCDNASLTVPATYCTRSCVRTDQCPGEMVCSRDGTCVYEDGGPAARGAACTENDQCSSGICATLEQNGPRVCADWCAMAIPGLCSDSEGCLENLEVPGTYACGPLPPFHVGCAVVSSRTTVVVVVLATLVIWRGRRRRRDLASVTPDRDLPVRL